MTQHRRALRAQGVGSLQSPVRSSFFSALPGFIGNIVGPGDRYWSDTDGPWGLVLSLGLDAVFIALGGYLLARGRRERPPGGECFESSGRLRHARRRTVTMDRILSDEATCRGEPPHRRGSHRFLRDLVATAAVGGSRRSPVVHRRLYFHLDDGVCLGTDHQPNEGNEVGALARPPSHPRRRGWRKSAVVGAKLVSGARDQDPRPVHQRPSRAHSLSFRFGTASLQSGGATTRPIGYVPCLWRRFRVGGRARTMSIALERKRHPCSHQHEAGSARR